MRYNGVGDVYVQMGMTRTRNARQEETRDKNRERDKTRDEMTTRREMKEER